MSFGDRMSEHDNPVPIGVVHQGRHDSSFDGILRRPRARQVSRQEICHFCKNKFNLSRTQHLLR